MKSKLNKFAMLMVMSMLMAFGIPLVLSADAQILRKESGLQSFPVEAATQIYKGAQVCLNAAGYLVAAADTAGLRFVGIAYEDVLGTTQGVLFCRVHTEGVFKLPATSITQAMVGRLMYVVDDATVDESSTNKICAGKLVEFVSTTEGWVDIGQRAEGINGYLDHVYINTDSAVKNVRLYVKTFTTNASIVGVQTKPRAGVNMTNDVVGMESMPGLGVTAITSTAGIVCFKAEPYIHATAGAITGDVRGYEVTLGCPTGAGTIGGVLSGMKFINNTTKAVTGGIFALHVTAHGDAQSWTGLMKLADEAGLASVSNSTILADISATANAGYIKVMVGTTEKYIPLYNLKAS